MRSRNNLARALRSPSVCEKESETSGTKLKKKKIQMKIRLISMISSQSKDVVNIYIKFRLLLLIKYVLQKCIELVKKIWYRFLARKVAPQNFKTHCSRLPYIACNKIKL